MQKEECNSWGKCGFIVSHRAASHAECTVQVMVWLDRELEVTCRKMRSYKLNNNEMVHASH